MLCGGTSAHTLSYKAATSGTRAPPRKWQCFSDLQSNGRTGEREMKREQAA